MIRKRLLQIVLILVLIEFVPAIVDFQDGCHGDIAEVFYCSEDTNTEGTLCDDHSSHFILHLDTWGWACTYRMLIVQESDFPSELNYGVDLLRVNWSTDTWEIKGSLTNIIYFRRIVIYHRSLQTLKDIPYIFNQLFPHAKP